MDEKRPVNSLTRRVLLGRWVAGAAAYAVGIARPNLAFGVDQPANSASGKSEEAQLYANTLKTWCDGLLARQVTEMRDPAFYGGLLCPACAFIHGRCGDAVYPLLRMAHSTGEAKYVRAAMLVHEWSQVQVSRVRLTCTFPAHAPAWPLAPILRFTRRCAIRSSGYTASPHRPWMNAHAGHSSPP